MKVVVVGGGIAGLAAATHLARRGHAVHVLEAADDVGGRAATLRRERTGDRCDVGTQYYHSSYDRALSLIRDVGLGRTLSTIRGNTRFFDDRVAGGSFVVNHRLPWIKPAGIAGNLEMIGFLLYRLAAHRIDTFALEDRPELDGRRALDVVKSPYLQEFLVRTLHVAGGLAEPETTDVCLLQLIRLMRIIILTDYVTLSGGVASLHRALAGRLDVRTGAPVRRLIVERGAVAGVVLEGSEEAIAADRVLVAAPPPRALSMLPDEWTVEREFLGGVRMPPTMIASFFLDRPLERSVWSYFFQAGRERSVSFMTDASQKSPAMVPSGNAILQAWVVHPASERFRDRPDDELSAACQREIEEVFPGFSSWIEEVHVTRHENGVPWHPVGHHGRALELLRSADRRRGVAFCGDYLSGGYLEPALWSAERAARRVAR